MTMQVEFRKPTAVDGSAICDLVEACKPLDENSMYCNLIQCDHFADTCIVAESEGRIVGWISGHIPPSKDNTLFVWQVAVHPDARGIGLAGRMLADLIERDELDDVKQIQTTITGDNDASWGLFKGFAKRIGAELSDTPYFTRDDHFAGQHATEHMVTIAFREALRKAA